MLNTLKQVQTTNRVLFIALVVMIWLTAQLILSSNDEMVKNMQIKTYSYNSNF